MSIWQEGAKRIRDGEDFDAVTSWVLATIPKKDLAAMVTPLVRDELRRCARALDRADEDRFRKAVSRGETAPEAMRTLVANTFALEDGTRVAFESATADQHMQRAAWLRGHAGALVQTAELHEDAAERIRKAGVECLADLGAPVAA